MMVEVKDHHCGKTQMVLTCDTCHTGDIETCDSMHPCLYVLSLFIKALVPALYLYLFPLPFVLNVS